MGDAAELGADGLVQFGDPMTERGDRRRGDRVEVAVAVEVDEFPALAPLDDDRRISGKTGHLRETMPEDGFVTADPARVRHPPHPSRGESAILLDKSMAPSTMLGSNRCRCTLWASASRPRNGRPIKPRAPSAVQSCRASCMPKRLLPAGPMAGIG